MSASREKKNRQGVSAQELTDREQKRTQNKKSEGLSLRAYGVIGVIVTVLAVAAVVLNSGVIQRNATAVTIGGTKYTAGAVQYYLSSLANQFGMNAASLKNTVMDAETGETMYDYFLEQALNSMTTVTALTDKAEAEGHTLSDASKESIQAALDEIDATWPSLGYPNRDTFLRASFGSYVTYEQLQELFAQQALADQYMAAEMEKISYTEADFQTYYEENADALDTYTYSQFVFQASVDTTDADGNTIEMTEEEKAAALEAAKEVQADLAEALQIRLEAGEDAQALADEFADSLFSADVSTTRVGSSLNTSYSEWMFETDRENGDVTVAEYESSTVYNYYVVRFEGRERDETPTDTVRHILVADEATAQSLLDQWKAGEATEDSFSALAAEHSTDTGSAIDGGLITGITPTASLVESFRDWSVDSSRETGDTTLVESEYGWHVMYYVGKGQPQWQITAENTLLNEASVELMEAAVEGYEAVQGSGMKYVG